MVEEDGGSDVGETGRMVDAEAMAWTHTRDDVSVMMKTTFPGLKVRSQGVCFVTMNEKSPVWMPR